MEQVEGSPSFMMGEGAIYNIEVYADVICPWCYIGTRDLERSFRHFPAATFNVRWRPYFIAPDLGAGGEAMHDFMMKRYGHTVDLANPQHPLNCAASSTGVTLSPQRRMYSSVRSQILIWHAGEQGGARLQRIMADAIMNAYFGHAANIDDPAVLCKLAAEAGVAGAKDILK
ncbi:unnamed protein product, partial [Phaeothamnion confervicola]